MPLEGLAASAQRRLAELRVNHRLVVADLVGVAVAAAVGVTLAAGVAGTSLRDIAVFASAALLAGMVVFPLAKLYRRHARSTSVQDALVVARGVACALPVQAVVVGGAFGHQGIDLGSYIVQFLAAVPILTVLRLAARHREVLRRTQGFRAAMQVAPGADTRVPVLIVGTGTSSDLFVRSCRAPGARFRPVGIIDDARDTAGLVFHDVEILGSLLRPDRLCEALRALDTLPQRLFLTEPVTHSDHDGVRKLVAWAEAHSVTISRLPSLGDPDLSQPARDAAEPRDVRPDEILDRPQKAVERSLLRNLFEGRRVLVTGAGGSIGSELTRQVASFNPAELVLLEQSELNAYTIDQDLAQHFPDVTRRVHVANIRDAERVNAIFAAHRPELVFNAAALKHVPLVEANPCEGVLTNVIGTRNVADAARFHGAIAMVQVSTDKAVNTTNVMGATKRVAEFYVQAQDRITRETEENTRFFSVRFGNVLGSSGSLIPLFQRQISKGGPLTVTDPRMTRFFMTIREAVQLTLVAAAKGLALRTGLGQIFVLDMGEPVRIIDLAERMIRLSGLRPGADIAIEIIGIRPGEKLFEELFDASETPLECGIPGVSAAAPAGVPISQLRAAIHRLQLAAIDGDEAAVKRGLQELVPGYGMSGAAEGAAGPGTTVPISRSVRKVMVPPGGFPDLRAASAGALT